MNNLNLNNNFTPIGSGKPIIEENLSKFWVSENGLAAARELFTQLKKGPKRLAQLGTLVKVPGKLKEFLAISCPVENEIRRDEKNAEWCGLSGEDESYWSIMVGDVRARFTPQKPPAVPQTNNTTETAISNGTHFWGTLSRKPDKWGGEEISVSNVQIERMEGIHDDIVFTKLSYFRQYVFDESFNFIVGFYDSNQNAYPEQEKKRAFMLRNWSDFRESVHFDTFDKYVSTKKNETPFNLEPSSGFITRYPDIMLFDQGKLYSGFKWQNGVLVATTIRQSIEKFEGGIPALAGANLYVFNKGDDIHFLNDSFILISPFFGFDKKKRKWPTSDDFVQDASFWEIIYQAHEEKDKDTDGDRKDTDDNGGDEDKKEDEDKEDAEKREEWADELVFLRNLKQYVASCGFKYDDRDLARFHTSVKCGMLTLLGGEPGTGKSSLVELYFRALGGKDNNKVSEDSFLKVDVNPSWMEPADLIGFRDQNNVFRPAENGLFNRLRKWNDEDGDRNHLWPICLEEINLACVEHYFSDFIQIISRGSGCLKYERKVSSDDSPNANASEIQCSDGDIAPEECAIRLTDNLRFVGTCNSDETTRSLSLRFLDRCNMIELSLSDEMKERLLDDAFAGRTAKVLPYELEQGHEVSANDFQEWTNHDAGNLEEVKKLLSGLMASFEKAGIAPSPRVIAEIAKYIRNRPPWGIGDGMSSEQDRIMCALDECIAQRILSRYKASPGSIAGFEELKSHLETQEHHMTLSCNMISKISQEYQKNMALI